MKGSQKRKIKLIIFPGNFLPHTGGLESHVDNFVKYLSKKDYDITIFTPDVLNAKENEVIHKNVKVIRYPAFEAVYNYPLAKFWRLKFWKLFFNLYKNDYDVVMTRSMFFTNSSLGLYFAKFRFRRYKLIHVEHSSDFSKLNSKFKMIVNMVYMHTLGRLILFLSDKVVGVSDGVKSFLNSKFIKSKKKQQAISVIRRGFDYDYVLKVKPNLQLKEKYKNYKIITFAGRLIEGKGLQDIISVLPNLKKKVVLIVMGDGGFRGNLEKSVIELGLEKNVIFLGKTSYYDVIANIKVSDIFINPSYTEGLPTNVLDGLFCGVKVLATDVGGTYEILGKNWKNDRYSLVKMKNLKQTERELNRLLDVRSKFDNEILDDLKQRFNWGNHANEYDKILMKLVNGDD